MEASPSAESVLGTATLASPESAMPPASGNAATANCCAPAVVVTTAAAPRPATVPDCAGAWVGPSAKALTTASALRREIIVAVIVPYLLRSVALVALDVAAGQVRGVVVRDGDVEEVRPAARLAVVARRVHRERVRAVSRWSIRGLERAGPGPGPAVWGPGDEAVAPGSDAPVEVEAAHLACRRRGVHSIRAVLHELDLAPGRLCLEAESREVPPVAELPAARHLAGHRRAGDRESCRDRLA